jgi:hypothetical protein
VLGAWNSITEARAWVYEYEVVVVLYVMCWLGLSIVDAGVVLPSLDILWFGSHATLATPIPTRRTRKTPTPDSDSDPDPDSLGNDNQLATCSPRMQFHSH